MPNRQFTLVEMLVVISIIAILAGLLLPSLEKSLESARGSNCRANLRQTGASAAMYSDDNNGWTVMAYRYNTMWYATLLKYYSSTQRQFACPSESYWAYSAQGISYGLNTMSFGETETSSKKFYAQKLSVLSGFGRNSRLMMVVDTIPVWSGYSTLRNTGANSCYWEPTGGVAPLNTSNSSWYPSYARHNECINAVMLDGHAESVPGTVYLLNPGDYCNPSMKAYGDGKLAIRTYSSSL